MKNTLLSFLFLLLTTVAFAQFGLKAGVNASRISTDDEDIENLKGKAGFQAGLVGKINLTEYIAIQPEVLYTRKGARYDYFQSEVTSKMDYLDVPLVLIYNPLNLPISFHIGPQFSYLIDTEVIYENILLSTGESVEVNKDRFEDYDFGFVAGAAITLQKAFLEFRFTRGLKKYEKDSSIGNFDIEPSSEHYSIQASIGFYL